MINNGKKIRLDDIRINTHRVGMSVFRLYLISLEDDSRKSLFGKRLTYKCQLLKVKHVYN